LVPEIQSSDNLTIIEFSRNNGKEEITAFFSFVIVQNSHDIKGVLHNYEK